MTSLSSYQTAPLADFPNFTRKQFFENKLFLRRWHTNKFNIKQKKKKNTFAVTSVFSCRFSWPISVLSFSSSNSCFRNTTLATLQYISNQRVPQLWFVRPICTNKRYHLWKSCRGGTSKSRFLRHSAGSNISLSQASVNLLQLLTSGSLHW